MHTEDLIINYCSKSEIVKNVCAVSPDVYRAILSEALIVETIHLSDLSAFMISSDQRDSFRVSDLEGQKKKEGLNGVAASVDKVSHEEIVRVWALSSHLEKLFQIVELTVDVTANLKSVKI